MASSIPNIGKELIIANMTVNDLNKELEVSRGEIVYLQDTLDTDTWIESLFLTLWVDCMAVLIIEQYMINQG